LDPLVLGTIEESNRTACILPVHFFS